MLGSVRHGPARRALPPELRQPRAGRAPTPAAALHSTKAGASRASEALFGVPRSRFRPSLDEKYGVFMYFPLKTGV